MCSLVYRWWEKRDKRKDAGHDERETLCRPGLGADYAVDVYPHYGSDVEATLRSGADIAHGLIGAGVYASHGYERSHIDGVENVLRLLCAYLGLPAAMEKG